MLVYLLILAAEGLFSQTKPDNKDCRKIILNYPESSNFDNYSLSHLQIFTDESDLISGSHVFNYSFDTFLVKASYNLSSGRGTFMCYNKQTLTLASSGEFVVSEIKERTEGGSIICYRDVIRDGVWLNRHGYDTTEVIRYVFNKGEMMSFSYYKRDSLLEGGNYKGGKPIGEWLMLGDYLEKACYNDNGDLIYSQLISRLDGKLQREYYPELLEKTTKLEGISESVDFWYIIDYNEQGAIRASGHYIYFLVDPDGPWYHMPYGLHKVYENGKITRKRYPKMPTKVIYSIYTFDADGNEYKTEYVKKIN